MFHQFILKLYSYRVWSVQVYGAFRIAFSIEIREVLHCYIIWTSGWRLNNNRVSPNFHHLLLRIKLHLNLSALSMVKILSHSLLHFSLESYFLDLAYIFEIRGDTSFLRKWAILTRHLASIEELFDSQAGEIFLLDSVFLEFIDERVQ